MKRLLARLVHAKGVVGHLDEVRSPSVRGWAAWKGTDQKPTVQLEIDGVIVAEAVADLYRSDLKGLISPSGCHGFNLEIPEANLEKGSHTIAVLVKGRGVRLKSKTSTIFVPAVGESLDGPKPNYLGHVDEISGEIVRGWVADRNNPGASIVVELLVDGTSVATAEANLFRGDLVAPGLIGGYHGFVLKIPQQFRDGMPHKIATKIQTTNFMISTVSRKLLQPKDDEGDPLHIAMPTVKKAIKMTVIMPTYNRGATMEATIRRFLPCLAKVDAELIVIDDGSKDDTPERLSVLASQNSSISFESIPNGGPGMARNRAANLARGDLLMLVGDDVAPVDDNFLLYHEMAHARFTKRGQAVLGKITWPDTDDIDVNFVMRHIQGEGQQQFGYNYMTPYSWYKWNLFYSSNVSVKKNIVKDWTADGFSGAFYLAAFEDPEFALRVSQRLESEKEEFSVLYLPTAKLVHYHKYDVEGFIRRQVSAGMMAHEFLRLHPGREVDLGLGELATRLKTPTAESMDFPVEHYLAIFEGLRSWAVVIDKHYGMGSQNWHGELLNSVFQLSFFEGYVRAHTTKINTANGCRYILESIRTSFNRAIMTEAIGNVPGFGFC